MNRASTATLLVALSSLLLALAPPQSSTDAAAAPLLLPATAATVDDDGGVDDDGETPRPTINEFYPEERPLSDCLSSLPKPGCGSEARGGWAQTTIFLAIVAGLAFIAWRIIAGARRARRAAGPATSTSGTPDATTVPGGDGGDRAP